MLEQLCLLFPQADIYTLVAQPEKLSKIIQQHCIIVSPLQKIPQGSRRYKALLPLFPATLRSFHVNNATRFLFSTDASVIKGLSRSSEIPHVCYCHSPPRYLWDLQKTYLQQAQGIGGFGRFVFRAVTPYVRQFDAEGAKRVTHFIANAEFVRERIQRIYGRESEVIHPPVDVDAFDPARDAEDFYLIVTELVPYKRVDIAIDAFNRIGKKLVIIGDGSEAASLRGRAKSNITFLGRQPFSVLKDHFERCRAFLYPQIEDFGITAVEAQAAGKPVIALGKGGALESVIENQTGVFFHYQTAEALAEAVNAFEKMSLSSSACRQNAEQFRPEIFRKKIKNFLCRKLPELFGNYEFPI